MQAQEDLKKEETWAENTSGSLGSVPDLGLTGNSQWELVEL